MSKLGFAKAARDALERRCGSCELQNQIAENSDGAEDVLIECIEAEYEAMDLTNSLGA